MEFQDFLTVDYKDLEYIRSLDEVKILVLKDFKDENFIGEGEGSHVDLIFQNFDFEVLALHRCYCWPPVSMQNLTTLTIVSCNTLRDCVVTSHMTKSLRNLKRLRVSYCRHLREVIEDQVQLKNLQVLIIEGCDKLKNLTGPSTSFPDLTFLHVENCYNLEFILSYTLAKRLEKLQTMHVADCPNVREVVMQHKGDQIEEPTIFGHLNTLKLQHLKNLESFYHGAFNFPRSLPEVEINFKSYKLDGNNDVNILIKKHHEEEKEGTH